MSHLGWSEVGEIDDQGLYEQLLDFEDKAGDENKKGSTSPERS